jgi:flagellin
MSLTVNTNLASLTAQNNIATNQASLSTAMQRLSSGMRINSAADDAAGYAISQRMTTQVNGNTQAVRNANDGISLTQTAQGDLSTITSNLQRVRELSVQSANASNSASDRAALNNEAQQLVSEINRVASNSSFNGVKLLDGTFNAQSFQVGANNTANDSITIASIGNATTTALGGSGTSTSTSVTGGATTIALAAGDVTLNGIQVGASQIGASAGQTAKSAYSIAAAINAVSSTSGVTATANATSVTGVTATGFGAVATGATLTVNGIQVGTIAAGGDAKGTGANTAAAINLVSGQSGVTATANATTGIVSLSAADGREITLGAGFTGAATGGLTAATTEGTVSLASNSASGITVSGGAVASAGLAAATTAPSTTLTVNSLSTINLSTATGSTNALSAIDGALAQVATSSASLGAYQNRLSSTIANLQTNNVNISASRSRITDADFATETANLSRSQVLQQAGTAMLAQANQSAQGVLSLLR